ncbi:MAG: hypothetical protein ACE5JQ_17280 [Candidatus Methylomirabilales bacterium]
MNAPKRVAVWAVAVFALLLLVGSPDTSRAIPFDLTGGGGDFAAGNQGTSVAATKDGLTLTLTALTKLDPASFDLTVFQPGTVPADREGTVLIDPLGAGVQRADGGGSGEISGIDGNPGDEALFLTFSSPLTASSTILILVNYVIADDDVEIYGLHQNL